MQFNRIPAEIDETVAREVPGASLEKEPNLDVEIIYLGGGNALLWFRNEGHVEGFIRYLSQKLLVDAPGLKGDIATIEFPITEGGRPFKEVLPKLVSHLKTQKIRRQLFYAQPKT